jgi:hypothetical protein
MAALTPTAGGVGASAFDDLARASGGGLSRRQILGASLAAFLASIFPSLSRPTGALADPACAGMRLPWTPSCTDPVTKVGYTPSSNGCGPANKWYSQLIPNHPAGANFGDPCNEHDICYGTCGRVKATCDDTFLRQMMMQCDDAYGAVPADLEGSLRLTQCYQAALLYYEFVSRGGEDAFLSAQAAACDCCTCNRTCPPGQQLDVALCKCVCPAGTTDCGGTCVDLQTDNSNCGTCGRSCGGDLTCQSGQCACDFPCFPGYTCCPQLPGDPPCVFTNDGVPFCILNICSVWDGCDHRFVRAPGRCQLC